ncbi:MAG: IS66 family insertion sequence element accessory protein TnpB [Myxococcota bacterium]
MIGTTRNIKVFARAEPTDLRAGYDALFALARDVLEQDPLSGHAFLFVSRNRKRCKVLVYDGTGLVIFTKRLETSTQFAAPWKHSRGDAIEMTMSELALFVEGSKAVWRTSLSPSAAFPAPVRSSPTSAV